MYAGQTTRKMVAKFRAVPLKFRKRPILTLEGKSYTQQNGRPLISGMWALLYLRASALCHPDLAGDVEPHENQPASKADCYDLWVGM
jgi:hypothetical protein